MNIETSNYKIISTRECIKYIEDNGLTIYDDSEYQIKSLSGLIYILPNNEVVLIPTNFDLNYPGIIFKTLGIFEQYRNMDFFPIGEDNMTWGERYNNQIKKFRENPAFYQKTLESLQISSPLKNIEDIKSAFIKIQTYIDGNNRKKFSFEQVDIICSFGLAIIDYMVNKKNYNLIFEEGYENYNPITKVLVEKNNERRNILHICFLSFDGNASKNATEDFIRFLGVD
ncbi:MAG: hypothetical protein QM763_15205 [Agriterribacter sp.]